MTNPTTAPMPYEIITGYNADRRVIRTHSISEADRIYRQLLKQGKQPTIYLGDLRVRGPR